MAKDRICDLCKELEDDHVFKVGVDKNKEVCICTYCLNDILKGFTLKFPEEKFSITGSIIK